MNVPESDELQAAARSIFKNNLSKTKGVIQSQSQGTLSLLNRTEQTTPEP
jgi:hypothetical protein